MTLIEMLLNPPLINGVPNADLVKRFTPQEIRETIQSLVAVEKIELANALGDAGISIYPESEDMLAICSLLSMMNQDWQTAVEMMDQLIDKQGEGTQPFTYIMMVRALRCNLEPARALEVARKGLSKYPNQVELVAEQLSLEEFDQSMLFKSGD
mgnify:FL=1